MKKRNDLLGVYKKEGPVFVKGKGSFLYDQVGNKYLDLFPGWGVSILGHCHPRLVKRIKQQASQLIFIPNNLRHHWQQDLATVIRKETFPGKVFFANSGTEAIEAAIKFSRLYGRSERYEVIAMRNSFHGRTLGAVSVTGQSKYRRPFTPLLAGAKIVDFNNFAAFKKKVTKKTVAVILELIQGEGGVNLAEKEYVNNLYRFCRRHDILFIVDEVQTGMGRTGKMFAYQHYNIKPDIITLAKGLGAGFPISCMVVADKIASTMRPGHHASTFGGSPLATSAGLEVFKVIKEEKLLQNTVKMGKYLVKKLNYLKEKYPLIKNIKGKGLMVGVELSQEGYSVFSQAMKQKLIINVTQNNIIRIMPALNVTKSEIDKGIAILEKIFKKLS
jgi:predicted acetylornithine/succinylornithine family transaminase